MLPPDPAARQAWLDSCNAGLTRIDTTGDSLFAWIPAGDPHEPRGLHQYVTDQLHAVLGLAPVILPLGTQDHAPQERTARIAPPPRLDSLAALLVWFQVRPEGRLAGAAMERSSGYLALDTALPRAIITAEQRHAFTPVPSSLSNVPMDLWLAVGYGRLAGAENIYVTRVLRVDTTWTNARPARFVRSLYHMQYPDGAHDAGIEDRAMFEFTVDTTGHAVPTTIRTLHAYLPAFANEGRRLILAAEFEPARIGQCRTPSRVTMPVDFVLGHE